jgi:hypothetical protein
MRSRRQIYENKGCLLSLPNKRYIEHRGECVGHGSIRFARTKNTMEKHDWSFLRSVAKVANEHGLCEILFKISRTLEEAVTAAFVMISPFSHGDPPLCSSRDAARFCSLQNTLIAVINTPGRDIPDLWRCDLFASLYYIFNTS